MGPEGAEAGTPPPEAAGEGAGGAQAPGMTPGPSPELIVTNRSGSVLLRNTILKSDHFPGERRALSPERQSPGPQGECQRAASPGSGLQAQAP